MPSEDFGFYLFRRAADPLMPWAAWSMITGEYPPPMWRIYQDQDYDAEINDWEAQRPKRPITEELRERLNGRDQL